MLHQHLLYPTPFLCLHVGIAISTPLEWKEHCSTDIPLPAIGCFQPNFTMSSVVQKKGKNI